MISRAILAAVLTLSAPRPSLVKEVEQFRAKHEGDYRRQYATLAGLFDLKSGITTVGSAAGNDVRLPSSAPSSVGRFVVSGDKAYNPPCSFNPYTTCPLPPKENRLTMRIPAGEKAYPHPPKQTQ